LRLVYRLERFVKPFLYNAARPLLQNRPVAPPIDAERVRRIAILRYDAIGDMVLTTAVLDLLRRRLPAAEIDMVASHRNEGIVRLDPRISRLFVYDRTWRSLWRLWRDSRSRDYDVILNLVSGMQPTPHRIRLRGVTELGIISNFMGGRRATKITWAYPGREKLNSALFNLQLREPRPLPYTELQLRIVCDTFGWTYDPSMCRLGIAIGPEHRERALAFHRTIGEAPYVVLNISSWKFRRWSPERNREFVERMLERHPELRIVVLSTTDDAGEARSLAAVDPARVAAYPPSSDILDVCALVERSDFVVSPDTSIVHIASACGRPIVGLFSTLNWLVWEWLPQGVPHRALITETEVPIDTISPAEVIRAFDELYAEVRAAACP
jgi:lipopolysaccharide heptosyltransferase III